MSVIPADVIEQAAATFRELCTPGGDYREGEDDEVDISLIARAILAERERTEKAIADALGTDERGPALIETARNAHRAEQREAAALREATE